MPQSLHPDFETTLPNTDYFFIGDGNIQLAVQWSRCERATPLGLIISNPERFGRKWSSLLFHPEFGLERTMVTVIIDGVRYRPGHQGLALRMDHANNHSAIIASWQAADCRIIERFSIKYIKSIPSTHRSITITSPTAHTITLEAALYANPALCDFFSNDASSLSAFGYERIALSTSNACTTNERFLNITPDREDGEWRAELTYSLGNQAVSPSSTNESSSISASQAGLAMRIADLFNASKAGLRAAIASNGRFDASIWQYGFEWSGDASMVAEALVYAGEFETARSVLTNVLTRLTNADGMCAESSRFRGGMMSELNNNGEVLKACHTYLEWTGDIEFLRSHYSRIKCVAEYLLRPEFVHAETGMLIAARDIWERTEWMGVRPGFDISHQTFAAVGLAAASAIAIAMKDDASSNRWAEAASTIRDSLVNHPTHSMIEDGRIVKRRLLDGSVQRSLAVDPSKDPQGLLKSFVAADSGLAGGADMSWEPDVSEVFPIVYGIVNAKSDAATKTLDALESLWSQTWEGGGYGRYNVLSEPDSPGPWPFATAYMAAALLEAGETERAIRAINWLAEKAGAGGSWFEFYGERPTPPLPPTGIIVWGWAQFITLVVRHVMAVRVEEGALTSSPRIGGLTGSIRFRDSFFTLA